MGWIMGNINMDTFKLGALDGLAAIITLVALIVAAVLVLLVVVINAIKLIKEHKDEKEDAEEDKFFEEYGITGDELFLNHKLATMREELRLKHPPKKVEPKKEEVNQPQKEEDKPVEPAKPVEEVKPVEQPKKEEVKPVVEEKKPEPAKPIEPPKPVEEKKPEPPQPVQPAKPVEPPKPVEEKKPEPPKPAPQPKTVEEEKKEEVKQEKQGVVPPAAAKKVAPKKPDDWSKYDGEFEGYYYDPEDACYYEGEPSPELAKKLAKKQAEIDAENAKNDKKVIIKKVAPPFVALKTPKNARKVPKKVTKGFDEAVIYGQYVIEHKDMPDGNKEYWYTLYDPNGKSVYESSNYTQLEYVNRAINRLKSHAIIGSYTIEAEGGKFFFVLKRKTYVHKGMPLATFDQANDNMRQFKSFVQTNVIREQ